MSREHHIAQLSTSAKVWDLAVIGGGAVGMGVALDAVARGYSCVLFEQHDFAKGTSSRSTKLIHGGVRYLAQGNVSLVREALHERELLLRNASELVQPLRFIVPCYSSWERWYYWAGMKCYDALAGKLGIRKSSRIRTATLSRAVPGLKTGGLRGGVAYYDAQFDDARLVIAMARQVRDRGGVPLNYFQVEKILMSEQQVCGVQVRDVETDRSFYVQAKAVVNAAGVFSDDVRKLESSSAPRMIAPSQGIHLVVDQKFLGGRDAIMIPKTKDGRVLFGIPWLGRAVLGTTDTPVQNASLEPVPLKDEIDYLLQHFSQYFDPAPTRRDVLSCFAGLRPLVKPQEEAGATSKISREHRVVLSAGGLISILGGKWTTFRKMAEDVVASAVEVADLPWKPPATAEMVLDIGVGSQPECPGAPPTADTIVRMARDEFARTVEDILARRFRCLLLDAKQSLNDAPAVAKVLAKELGKSDDWVEEQISAYKQLVQQYVLD